jgi:MtN3 and saliva related transmembrane protein
MVSFVQFLYKPTRVTSTMTALGFIAGTLTTLAFLPQVIRSYRTRSAASLSWGWLVLFGSGVAAWACYGVLRDDVAIVWTNSVTLLLVLGLVALRARPAK